jgi:hypothetical protein
VVASVTRYVTVWRCPECGDNILDGRRRCPACGVRPIRTSVREDRLISWSGVHPSPAAIRAVLDPETVPAVKTAIQNIEDSMPAPRSHVFISYVRRDAAAVDRLAADLRNAGLHPWVDRTALVGGQRWKGAIRKAIQEGSGVVVCFSTNYSSRSKTYMNEELTIMIDELRQRPADKSWCIPVRLDDCAIPDRTISQVETLHDLQHIDLFPDWDQGVRELVTALRNP